MSRSRSRLLPVGIRLALTLLALLEIGLNRAAFFAADGLAVTLVVGALWTSLWCPRIGAALALAGGIVGYSVAEQPLLVPSMAALIAVGMLVRRGVPATVVVVATGIAVGSGLAITKGVMDTGRWLLEVLVAVALVAAVAGTALARRNRAHAVRAEADAREQRIETERREAALAERARIARELHDVVAHSVSVIAVLAETAPYAISGLSAAADERFAEIASSARTTLGELRDMLDLLRRDGSQEEGIGRMPIPDLDKVPLLIDEHRRAGGQVELNASGTRRRLPVAVEIAAYRIIQEALTNIRRHTLEAKATVRLEHQPEQLIIEIINSGESTTGTGPPGYGLLGMNERVAALSGQLSAEPYGHGFRVSAIIPITQGSP